MAFYSLAENSFVYHYTHLVHIDCLSFISRVLFGLFLCIINCFVNNIIFNYCYYRYFAYICRKKELLWTTITR